MICYRDRTYCASVLHVKNCPRRITDKERAEAKKLNLPIAWAYFCSEPSETHQLNKKGME